MKRALGARPGARSRSKNATSWNERSLVAVCNANVVERGFQEGVALWSRTGQNRVEAKGRCNGGGGHSGVAVDQRRGPRGPREG